MKYTLVFVISLLSIVTFAQTKPGDSTVSCEAHWVKGEKKILSIARHKESTDANKPKPNFDFNYQAHVSVLDSTSAGYTIQWIFQLPEAVRAQNPELANALSVYNGMKMVYKTSVTGEFIELVNWEEVRDTYVKMMMYSLPDLDSVGEAAVAKSREMFNSRKVVESSLIKEIHLFHLPYGRKFSTVEKNEPTELENPFSAKPLPAMEIARLVEMNSEQKYCKLIIQQKIDTAGALAMMEDILTKMEIDDTDVLEVKKALSNLEINDTNEYISIQPSGWMKKVTNTRIVKNGERRQQESTTIEMLN